jgi:hypothetical protein
LLRSLWTRPDYLATEPLGVNDDLLHVGNEEFGDDPVLSEIEKRVAEHNRRTQAQMVTQSRAHGVITEFEDGDIVLNGQPRSVLETQC